MIYVPHTWISGTDVGCLFGRNLSYRGWSFGMAALRSFFRLIIERHFVLTAVTADNPVSNT
jgi:hypothetical protein